MCGARDTPDARCARCIRFTPYAGPKGPLVHWSTLRSQHTHTRLTALCPRLPGWAGTRKVKTNLDLTEATDSQWQWHQLGHMQGCTSLQADNHASTAQFFTGRMPFQPTVSRYWRHVAIAKSCQFAWPSTIGLHFPTFPAIWVTFMTTFGLANLHPVPNPMTESKCVYSPVAYSDWPLSPSYVIYDHFHA